MNNIIWFLLSIFFIYVSSGCGNKHPDHERLMNYLSQPSPDTKPVLFSSHLLPENIRDVAFTPDGKEFYFTHLKNDTYTIMCSVYESGEWSVASVAPFSGTYNDFEPCIPVNGQKFYFASMRPSAGKEDMTNDIDIWVMDRTDNGWSKPELLGEAVNSKCMEYYPSVTKDRTLYFGRNDFELTRGDIYFSRYVEGRYAHPSKLPESVNLPGSSFNAFISMNEDYIIFSTHVKDSLSSHSDLFISFRDRDGSWNESMNMGVPINSRGNEFSPWVSHDGKYLFFASTRLDSTGKNKKHDIFWVDARIIETYKLKN